MSQLITMLAILASAVSITIIDRVFDTCADSEESRSASLVNSGY